MRHRLRDVLRRRRRRRTTGADQVFRCGTRRIGNLRQAGETRGGHHELQHRALGYHRGADARRDHDVGRRPAGAAGARGVRDDLNRPLPGERLEEARFYFYFRIHTGD